MPVVVIAVLEWLASKLFILFVVQLILSLGMAFVTYSGAQAAIDYLKSGVLSAIGQLPDDAFNLLMIAGFGEGISYLFGAFSFWAAMKATSRLKFGFWN